MEAIHRSIAKCAEFSAEELAIFDGLLESKCVPKKALLLSPGEVCNFEAYIVKGCIRSCYLDDNGAEVVLQFSVEDWWVSDVASFQEQKPASLFIETLEECELLILNFQHKEELLQRVPKFERVFRLMVQRHLAALQERLIKNIALPAADRYQEFISRYPTIPQRVPQHYIASYLGITPEFLSKIRARTNKA